MAKHIFSLSLIALLLSLLSCSENDNVITLRPSLVNEGELRKAALTDNFVSSELMPASDDASSPLALPGESSAAAAIKVFKIMKRVSKVESSTQIDRIDDTTLVVTVHRTTSGTLTLQASYNQEATAPDTTISKPLAESFSRKVLFFLKDREDDDEFESSGTIADLAKDCTEGTGSFNLIHDSVSTLIFFSKETELESLTCAALENGVRVKVEAQHRMVSPTRQEGWLAKEIERADDEGDDEHSNRNSHADFKKAGISLLEGGTTTKSAMITEMRIYFANNDSVVINSPQEYFFYTGKRKHAMCVLNARASMRIQVVVASAHAEPEVVILRRGNLAFGKVSFKRQLQLVGEQTVGSTAIRTYEVSLPEHGMSGYFHNFVEAWTSESVYDDAGAVSTHSWSIPYIVQ